MKLRVLGCAGGIGGRERFTTSLLVDDDILLDAGTGLTSLDLDALARIEHVFITHSHLDHVAGLALLVDAVQGRRRGPINVHATENVVTALKQHLFNWILWPDFAAIPDTEHPSLRWQTLAPGSVTVLGGRRITAHHVNHMAGSVGYLVDNAESAFLFTGDMASTPELWAAMRGESKLSKVIVDCSFANSDMALAALSMHFCPRALIEDIRDVSRAVEFLIYHLKAGQEDAIMHELDAEGCGRAFRALKCGDEFVF